MERYIEKGFLLGIAEIYYEAIVLLLKLKYIIYIPLLSYLLIYSYRVSPIHY